MPVIAGSCVYTTWKHEHITICRWQWVSDANGDVKYYMDDEINGIPWRLTTFPSPVDAPTLNYDIRITNTSGADQLLGQGVDRHNSNVETTWIRDATLTTAHTEMHGKHDFIVSDAGATKSGVTELSLIQEDEITSPAMLF